MSKYDSTKEKAPLARGFSVCCKLLVRHAFELNVHTAILGATFIGLIGRNWL